MKVAVVQESLQPWQELALYEAEVVNAHCSGKYGACATFIGTMRDINQGEAVKAMTLEHYPGMTEHELQRIVDEAAQRWALLDALVLHRVGELQINEPIVLVAVWSAHRREAFEACRHIMDALKSRAPLWKKEQLEVGQRWVDNNTDGY